MKGKFLKRFGVFLFAALMFSGVVFVSASTAEAQTNNQAQSRRRVIVVPRRRFYRGFRYRDPWYYDRWGYDPWSPYGSRYHQYVFDNSEKAVNQGYRDGFKTGKDDGKKAKSYNPERSHYYHDSGFGNFAEVYRSGFSRGYQEGYRVGNNSRAS